MPFSVTAFLDVFAAYNQAVWPLVAVLWLLTAGVSAAFMSGARLWAPLPRLLLAGHWLWAGLVYHAFFFTAINPAAWVFAGLFIAQAVLLLATRSSDWSAASSGGMRRVVSSVLIVYSLIYPAVAWADGFSYPRMPTFGVPCSTVVFTIGFLVAVSTPSIRLSTVPVVWSLIGGTAAWFFGVHADLALPAAAAVLAGDLIFNRSHVMKKLSFAGVLALLVAMLTFVPASALAQASQYDHEQQAQKSGMKMDQMKMGEMKMDGKMMEQMAAKKQANTERINALMAQVKNGSGDARVTAMADVLAVLLEERTAMHEHCAAMMAMMKPVAGSR